MGNIRMLRRGLRGVISRRALLDGSKYGYHVQGKLIGFSHDRTLNTMLFFSRCDLSLGNYLVASCTLPLSHRWSPSIGFSALGIAREQFGTRSVAVPLDISLIMHDYVATGRDT